MVSACPSKTKQIAQRTAISVATRRKVYSALAEMAN